MNTISNLVSEFIYKEPFLVEMISNEMVNLSALARKLKPEIERVQGKPITASSVMMALKRLTPEIQLKLQKLALPRQTIFQNITIRSNLCDYTFENAPTLVLCQKNLLENFIKNSDVFYTVSRGVHESTIIISSNYSEMLEQLFVNETLLSKTINLGSLSMTLPKNNTIVIGLYYSIFKNIAWNGINIYEVISTTNEITILVNELDLGRAFEILNGFKFQVIN